MTLIPMLDLRPAHDDGGISHAPSNLEAEQALLGIIMFDNAAYERLPDSLKPQHFYEPFHSRLFASMEEHIRKGQLAEPILLEERTVRAGARVGLQFYPIPRPGDAKLN